MNIRALSPQHSAVIMPLVLGSALLIGLSIQTISLIMVAQSSNLAMFTEEATKIRLTSEIAKPTQRVATAVSDPTPIKEALSEPRLNIKQTAPPKASEPVWEPALEIVEVKQPAIPATMPVVETPHKDRTIPPEPMLAPPMPMIATAPMATKTVFSSPVATTHSTQRNWLDTAAKGHYTLQLIMAKNKNNTHGFFVKHAATAATALVGLDLKNKQWYAVIQGDYDTAPAARDAAKIYKTRTGQQAWVRPISSVLKEVNQHIESRIP